MFFINNKKKKNEKKNALCDRKMKKKYRISDILFTYLQIYNLIIHIVFIKSEHLNFCIANFFKLES